MSEVSGDPLGGTKTEKSPTIQMKLVIADSSLGL
jgi:hypothetical protein